MRRMKKIDYKLKKFIEDNIPFEELKEIGFFSKETKKNHYEKIAERVCWHFGLKSIYDYNSVSFTAHISYSEEERNKHSFIESFGKDKNVRKAEVNLMYPNNDN